MEYVKCYTDWDSTRRKRRYPVGSERIEFSPIKKPRA